MATRAVKVGWRVLKSSELNPDLGAEGGVLKYMIARFRSKWKANHSKTGQNKATSP
jgi:hypothetical protein